MAPPLLPAEKSPEKTSNLLKQHVFCRENGKE